jgi:hypothetical protein
MMTKTATVDRGGVDAEEISRTLARVAELEAGDAVARARAMAGLDASDDVRRAGLDAAHRARVLEARTDEIRVLTQQRAALWGVGGGAAVSVGYMLAGPVGGVAAGVVAFVASKWLGGPDRALHRRTLR